MGYSTQFSGGFKLNRELTHKEWIDLRELGTYEREVYEKYTDTPDTIPSSYLQWEPNDEGTEIVWNGEEKFYDYVHWLRWLAKHYLTPHGLVINGQVKWQGDEIGDVGVLTALDNKVTIKKAIIEGVVTCPECFHRFVPKNV